MALSKKQTKTVEETLKTSLRNKFKNHNPEPASMPFHTRLLGKDRLAFYSFIHSLNTNFGTTIFEPVALALAQNNFKMANSQVKVGNKISSEAQKEIQKIIDGLTTATTSPDKKSEIKRIRKVCQQGKMVKVKPTKIDLMFETKGGEYFLFDIKTAKPNAGGFTEFKRTLLEWVAVMLADNPKAKVNTLIAIPYNPYEPDPYNRWTMRGMLDLKNELKVADEFWDFLGGKNTYKDLLDCFERVGIELRDEINDYFKRFNKNSGGSKTKISLSFLFHLAAGVWRSRQKNERKFWVLPTSGASAEVRRCRRCHALRVYDFVQSNHAREAWSGVPFKKDSRKG